MMKAKSGDGKKMKAQSTLQIRTTISFPAELYETLQEIAKKKKVSLAWVVRDATERYVADQGAKGKVGETASFRATGKATRRAR
jgi:predicted transcriptional regulator